MSYATLITSSGLPLVGDNVGGLGNVDVVKLDIGALGATSGPVGLTNPLPVRRAPATLLNDTTVTWANSAAALTEKVVDLDISAVAISPNGGLLVIVRNPSTETALAGELRNTYVDGSTTRYSKLSAFVVASSNADGESFLFDSGLLAAQRVSLKNSTGLDGSGGFTARVQAWAF